MEIKQVRENGNVTLLTFNNRFFILMPLQETNEARFSEYKEFKIKKWNEDNGEIKTLIELNENEFVDEVFDIISDRINNGENIFNILHNLNKLLSKYKEDYLKLRGDVGEALFILNNGGVKADDSETFDIIWNKKYVEVKTFSPQKKTIDISLKQLEDQTLKYAVPIIQDSNGMNILELADIIDETNPDFASYIKNTYNDMSYLGFLKFKNEIPFDITSQLSDEIILPKNVVAAKFSIFIEK